MRVHYNGLAAQSTDSGVSFVHWVDGCVESYLLPIASSLLKSSSKIELDADTTVEIHAHDPRRVSYALHLFAANSKQWLLRITP
jgi:hypothetical protein